MRRRASPSRTVGDQVVVAHFDRDAALVLAPTAAVVWRALSSWRSSADLGRVLAEQYPDITAAERDGALGRILELLGEADLLERAP